MKKESWIGYKDQFPVNMELVRFFYCDDENEPTLLFWFNDVDYVEWVFSSKKEQQKVYALLNKRFVRVL